MLLFFAYDDRCTILYPFGSFFCRYLTCKVFTCFFCDDVQNFIGYMVDGRKDLTIKIEREVIA